MNDVLDDAGREINTRFGTYEEQKQPPSANEAPPQTDEACLLPDSGEHSGSGGVSRRPATGTGIIGPLGVSGRECRPCSNPRPEPKP
jgi:hypothetical protein